MVQIPLSAFHHIEVKKTQFVIEFIPLFFWRIEICYYEGDQLKRCRLKDFDHKTVDVLNNQIRLKRIEQMDPEKKIEIIDSVNTGLSTQELPLGTEFTLNHDQLLSNESLTQRKALRIYALLWAISLGYILLVHTFSVATFEMGVIVIFFSIVIPVKIMEFKKNKAMYPSRINVSSAGLTVDQKYFPYNRINKIKLNKVTKSQVLPAQYYMEIQGDGKEKYWLGSDQSFPEYATFCDTLQKAMIFSPGKLECNNKSY